jgi:hypothetical protein
MKLLWFIAGLAVAGASAIGTAHATSLREKQSNTVWRKQDDCTHAAFLKFPDYTPESNAARERDARACEIRNHVPVRLPVISSPVKKIPDAEAN